MPFPGRLFILRHRLRHSSILKSPSPSSSRCISTPSLGLEVDLSHPIYMIWGSNTGVGKTLVSAGLASSVLCPTAPSLPSKFVYIKPVQTGFPEDSDSRYVYRKTAEFFLQQKRSNSLLVSNQVVRTSEVAGEELLADSKGDEEIEVFNGFRKLCFYEERKLRGVDSPVEGFELVCKMMYGWKEPVSPHLVAKRENAMVGDCELIEALQKCLRENSRNENFKGEREIWSIIETAGGVASPGPSGSLQCDIYRPFRLPAILVGDGRLGGISGTISAYESLRLRGYDVAAIIIEDHGLANESSLSHYVGDRVQFFVLPRIPRDSSDGLMGWFSDSHGIFTLVKQTMLDHFLKRVHRLHEMPKKAESVFWWPFTQHGLVHSDSITSIDSRCGENFAVHKAVNDNMNGLIAQQFDACASWWTQGPDAAFQMELARDMGYTAARYGHVMFPENVYEPALQCAECLIDGVGKGWASRVYFSDNGSTAIEIALKMAFRKFSYDHGLFDSIKGFVRDEVMDFKVVALSGSYHGDTLGAMEAQAPSPYTGFCQQPWYSGRGLFLDPPTAFISDMYWNVNLPDALRASLPMTNMEAFESRIELFSKSRDCSPLAEVYSSYINQKLLLNSQASGSACVAALIIEPVIHGAGGMHIIDPLFQRILVRECQKQKIPVIFDEVFAGFWRLGVESAAQLLGCLPDIACYAKLMTGGVVPLAATLATEAVFSAFYGDSKLMALLHGHSYSAHALGCAAAAKAIQWFKSPNTNPNLIPGKRQLKELWDSKLVYQLSSCPGVERVVALGTVCAIELRAVGVDSGYASLYARSLLQKFREDGIYMRPLGNVIYLMCGPCTSPSVCFKLLSKVYERISQFDAMEVTKKSVSL